MTRPATIVFDLDGTLVDTAPDLIGALNHALSLEGVAPVAANEARSMIGAGAKALLARGLSAQGRVVTDERFRALHAAFLEHYEANIAVLSRPFPEIEAAITRLTQDGHRLAVCTNKVERFAVMLLEALGLRAAFAAVVGGDTVHVQKPDPLPLREAIARAGGASGAPAILVGDSATDLWTARAAGVPLIGVSFGYTETPMRELGPDRLIDSFDALPQAVEDLLGRA